MDFVVKRLYLFIKLWCFFFYLLIYKTIHYFKNLLVVNKCCLVKYLLMRASASPGPKTIPREQHEAMAAIWIVLSSNTSLRCGIIGEVHTSVDPTITYCRFTVKVFFFLLLLLINTIVLIPGKSNMNHKKIIYIHNIVCSIILMVYGSWKWSYLNNKMYL